MMTDIPLEPRGGAVASCLTGARGPPHWLPMMKGNGDKAVELLSQHLQDWIENCGPQVCKCCHPLPSGSPAVGWLTEERGCMMQVLERSAPEVGMEGRH